MYRVNQCGALGTFSICSLHQHNDALLGRGEPPRFLVAIIALSIAAGGGVGLPRTDGQRPPARSFLALFLRLPPPLARFMIARRHHDHRLQMRRRRRRSWRTSGQGRGRKASTDSIHPRSCSLSLSARIQPTVQRTSKDRGSTRSFARSAATATAAMANRARSGQTTAKSRAIARTSESAVVVTFLPRPAPPCLAIPTWARRRR